MTPRYSSDTSRPCIDPFFFLCSVVEDHSSVLRGGGCNRPSVYYLFILLCFPHPSLPPVFTPVESPHLFPFSPPSCFLLVSGQRTPCPPVCVVSTRSVPVYPLCTYAFCILSVYEFTQFYSLCLLVPLCALCQQATSRPLPVPTYSHILIRTSS